MSKIPIFKLTFDQEFRKKFYERSEQIFNEGHLTNHTMVKELEADFCRRNQSKFALAVSSGTSALEVALLALNISGKEVILPTNTFIATYIAVKRAGGIPVILDIEDQYFSLSAEQLEKYISERTGAVITVHIGGHVSPEIKKIRALCQAKGVPLMEDAAHAHFAELDGVRAGNFGEVGCFSFHMTKVVTSGEGGLVTISNPEIYQRARSSRQFGMDLQDNISHVREGANHKLGEFNALLAMLDLERAEERIGARRRLARRYQQNLQNTPWRCLQDPEGGKGSYYKQVILSPDGLKREQIQEHLSRAEIALTGGVYYRPLHLQEICAEDVPKGQRFTVAEKFSSAHICPPCYPELTLDEVDRVCEELLKLARS